MIRSFFFKGRYIGGNIRLLYNTLLYAKQHQIPDLLLMVEFEKAFDSVACSFIEKSLRKFKFTPTLIHVCMRMDNFLNGLT